MVVVGVVVGVVVVVAVAVAVGVAVAVAVVMTRAQKILLASHLLLRRLREAGIELETDVRLEFYRRMEGWCVQAQLQEPAG